MNVKSEFNYEYLHFGNDFNKMRNCTVGVRCGNSLVESPGMPCKSYRDGECKLIKYIKHLTEEGVRFKT